jgi:hypothetical protein
MKNVINFLGFDVFGAAVKGGSGADKDDPTLLAYTGTPIADELTNLAFGSTWTDPATASFSYNNAGVTGLEKHKIGVGDERRNTFLIQAGRNSSTTVKTTVWTSGTDRGNPGVVGKRFGYRFSFNLTDFTEFPNPAAPIAHAVPNVDAFYGSNSLPIVTRAVTGTRVWWNFNGVASNLCPDVVKGQPVHVEVEIGCENPGTAANATLEIKIYVNGDLLYTGKPYSIAQTSVAACRLRFTAQAAASTYMNSFGISDLVISKATDNADVWLPVLGPQVVLPAALDSVEGAGWQTVGASAVVALTDGSDETYMISPALKTPLDAKFDLRLPVGAEVNGLSVFMRGRRDIPASAPLRFDTDVIRQLDGVKVASDAQRALTANLAYYKPVTLVPNNEAGETALQFADSGKLSVRLNVS